MTRAVLAPGQSYARIRDALAAAGWREEPSRGLRLPLRPGEPETAVFSSGEGLLSYSFNPALDLRQVEGDRLPPDTVLPRVARAEVEGWMGSPHPETCLRGILAAEALGLNGLAKTASAAAEALPPEVRPLGRRAAARLAPPDPAAAGRAAFAALPTMLRRGVLRQMLADRPTAAAGILGEALSGNDPELATTAMIGAARIGRADLDPAVKRAILDLADLDRLARARLKAIRALTLETLSGARPDSADTPRNRFWRLLLGAPGDGADAAFLDALTLPPPEIIAVEGLTTETLAFHRVATVPHWIGHEDPPSGRAFDASPLHRWTPSAPFAASVTATEDAVPDTDIPARLAELAREVGRHLRLPTAAEWEAAMRGPGGWQRPWGLGSAPPADFVTGPWGLAPPTRGGEWATEAGRPVLMGCEPRGHLAGRQAPDLEARAHLRAVLCPR